MTTRSSITAWSESIRIFNKLCTYKRPGQLKVIPFFGIKMCKCKVNENKESIEAMTIIHIFPSVYTPMTRRDLSYRKTP